MKDDDGLYRAGMDTAVLYPREGKEKDMDMLMLSFSKNPFPYLCFLAYFLRKGRKERPSLFG